MRILIGAVMAAAIAITAGQALAAPSAFILGVSDFTAKTYQVTVRQSGGGQHTFILADGHRSHTLSLKIEAATVTISGPNCNVSQSVSPQNTLTLEIRKGADGNCRITSLGTTYGF